MSKLKEWDNENVKLLKPKTRELYIKRIYHYLNWLEQNYEKFKADSLLSDDAPVIPHIDKYLSTLKPTMKAPSLAGSQYLFHFLNSYHESRGLESGRNNLKKNLLRSSFLSNVLNNKDLFGSTKRESHQVWIENREKRTEDPNDLTYNPHRCAEIMDQLLESTQLKELIHSFAASGELLYDWSKVNIRDLLIALLIVFGGGQRCSVPCRMTILEFNNAKLLENGKHEVKST